MVLTKEETIALIKSNVTITPNFPKEGINFLDVFPIMRNSELFKECIAIMAENILINGKPDVVVGLDARGFIFGVLVAQKLNLPFVPIRKVGKLPGACKSLVYSLEYGEATFELQTSAIPRGSEVVIVDDLLATGGTMHCACELVRAVGSSVQLCVVVIELPELHGREKQKDKVYSLLEFEE